MDLGLPGGTLWATMNVGASKPSDYGLYFQWGDTSGYTADQVGKDKQFASDWSDYKWGVAPNFTKYTDILTLDLEDDAAHVYMGGDWHMPSYDQINDLIDNTTTTWTTSDGISGVTFTSKKDKLKSIFIPAAGFAYSGSVVDSGSDTCVWALDLDMDDTDTSNFGWYLDCGSEDAVLDYIGRYIGCSIRGVI